MIWAIARRKTISWTVPDIGRHITAQAAFHCAGRVPLILLFLFCVSVFVPPVSVVASSCETVLLGGGHVGGGGTAGGGGAFTSGGAFTGGGAFTCLKLRSAIAGGCICKWVSAAAVVPSMWSREPMSAVSVVVVAAASAITGGGAGGGAFDVVPGARRTTALDVVAGVLSAAASAIGCRRAASAALDGGHLGRAVGGCICNRVSAASAIESSTSIGSAAWATNGGPRRPERVEAIIKLVTGRDWS